jgi:ATP-dependent Lhr-like helicase
MREVRRTPADDRLITLSAADPLNLAGIVTAGDRVRSSVATRIVFKDGIALAVLEGDFLRPLTEVPHNMAAEVATALAGRPVPPVVSGYVGRN